MADLTIECVQGDIASQPDMESIVNAANARLMPGSGVAGAIHSAAGPELARECESLAPIAPGQAVITGGYGLPNPYVIHCLGPVYGVDEPSAELLGNCYRNALMLADQKGLTSIAFPAISTGVFGYPVEEAARIAVATIQSTARELTSVRRVRLVLFSDHDLTVFRNALNAGGNSG
ncbi:macro domain-containing protein [Marinobacter koreensis]|uniref:Macro domain-containing protein n=1 Tax=Marinobacter koreensis TaxID=335974 RepID=A0ABW0RNN2_9GAMM|nr:macro domain-containing protein [Marinobacter koreensis]MCK7547528.1 macro domain-containing protein [Marinobacter koreensis]